METKYHLLAKKLKALAEQGVGGEKYNAQQKLNSLMKRYNITEDDLSEDARSSVKFRIQKEQRKLFYYVYVSVVGWERDLRQWKKPPYYFVGDVTPLEELEIRTKFDFYWKQYEQNLAMFLQAFIHKNRLYGPLDESGSDQETTLEQQDRINKIAAMMQGIQSVSYRKQLSRGEPA
jgi:hypothetical protein